MNENNRNWNWLIGPILFIAMTFAIEYGRYMGAMEKEKLHEHSHLSEINQLQNPLVKDINGDGRQDLIFKLNSGDDFIFYKTDNGYVSELNYKGKK